MKWKRVSVVVILACVLLFSSMLPHTVSASPVKGPRTEDLVISFYATPEGCYAALIVGEIDIMAWPLMPWMYEDAISDPNIQLAPFVGNDMFGFSFNINETILTYSDPEPKLVSPMTYLEFRQALALLIDKDYIVNQICRGFAKRIDVPLPYPQKAWWNESVIFPYYPYEYDPFQAATLLDEAGFVQGTTPNPYYDPNYPGSAEYIRTYPPDHEYVGEDLHPIVFCSRKDQKLMLAAGGELADNMRKLGIPVNLIEDWPGNLYSKVMEDRDYHIYIGGQITWRFPIYLCLLYYWVFLWLLPGGLVEIPPLIKHLYWLDPLHKKLIESYLTSLEEAWMSPSYEETMGVIKDAQGFYVESVLGVPVWCTSSFYAYRKELLGVVNMDAYGIVNSYTFMNAYRTDGGPIRIGLVSWPIQMNILHSRYSVDYQILDRIFSDLMSVPPYNLVVDQPWVAQDWDVGTWINPETGNESTVIDYWFRKDVYWVEPVTGTQGPQFTAKDYEFTCHYIYACSPGCPHHGRFKDIYNVTIIDDFHVRVFMNVSSYWASYWPTYPLLPKDVWLREPLAVQQSAYFEAGVNITLLGVIPLPEPVVSGSVDTNVKARLTDGSEAWLEWGKDFTWTKGNLVIKVDSIESVPIDKVWVDYWIYGNAAGYYLGGLDWKETMVGCGPYYVTDIHRLDGYVVLKRNPYFWMDTPPLGEIDFAWKWGPSDVPEGPRTGYFKVDIYDVVLVNGAYGSTGNGIPSENWWPGADLVLPCCKIDIYDVVTVTNKYGTEFGHPPP